MAKRFEYTFLAQLYTARFPILTYVGTQTNFWILANILLASIVTLQSKAISHIFGISVEGRPGPIFVIAVVLGILCGVAVGLTDYYLEKRVFRKLSLGKVILVKALRSIAILILLLLATRFALIHLLVWQSIYPTSVALNDQAWNYTFSLLMVYYFCMSFVISFINLVNKKYGPGVLIPLLLGRYRQPREEERVFLFMDLKSSTTIAEKLGHLKYSSFIRDCFMDINEVLMPFRAQVYQYVGDEIVLTWPQREGIKDGYCINFFFACKDQFKKRSAYYMKKYGLPPEFKAGAHGGKVTVVEIGDIKRDIAYHGDILNTAARIQSVCNLYNKDFLVSEHLARKVNCVESVRQEPLGSIQLKGKSVKVGIVSLEEELS